MGPVIRLEVVQLVRLPGHCRALVPEDVAEIGEKMGELRRLDLAADPVPLRLAFPVAGLPVWVDPSA